MFDNEKWFSSRSISADSVRRKCSNRNKEHFLLLQIFILDFRSAWTPRMPLKCAVYKVNSTIWSVRRSSDTEVACDRDPRWPLLESHEHTNFVWVSQCSRLCILISAQACTVKWSLRLRKKWGSDHPANHPPLTSNFWTPSGVGTTNSVGSQMFGESVLSV